jgi:hypothetical protein
MGDVEQRETGADDVSELVDHLKSMLRMEPMNPQQAGEKFMSLLPSLPEDYKRRIERAVIELEFQEKKIITLLPAPTVTSGKQNRWYIGPPENGSPNWFAYRKHLLNRGWGEEAIESIDRASTKITNELLCPNGNRDGHFQGLVLGYVQSGKTANMAATIAKAADSGYRMVIVLAGMTNVLRQQTQSRLMTDVLAHNPHLWWEGTTIEKDFKLEKGIKLPAIEKGKCSLFVIKKNAAVLRRLKKALNQLSEMERKVLPTLIIDDECDQASINTAAYRSSVTRINSLIRDLREKLPKATYVGFTATPYANVLMAEKSVDGTRDLYPSEFIVSLDEPEAYFGARRLFGDDFDAENDSELPYIRRVPEEDRSSLQPASRKGRDGFSPVLTASLKDACDYYLLALAARQARGQGQEHCCMLIHTTIYAGCHRRLRRMVEREWLAPLLQGLRADDKQVLEDLRLLWEKESQVLPASRRTGLSCPATSENFSDLAPYLLPAAERISMTVENSESELSDRLDFSAGEPVQSIVIGGNVLARGLTIEGLVCSYFIRSSTQYDTLMQMGRWFGYRRGFEDLPRIWMTRELENAFRDLVNVEEMIRSEILEIGRKGWTPSDMAVRVPQIAGLSITARNKLVMDNLEQCDVSYYGTHEQTISFPVDSEFHISNWDAGNALIADLMQSSVISHGSQGSSYLFREVGYRAVLRFLRSYRIGKDSMAGVTEFVEREVDNGEECMEVWNVGIIGSRNCRSFTIGGLHDLKMVTRNKINPRYQTRTGQSMDQELQSLIYIKALMGVRDILIDVESERYKTWMKELVNPDFDTKVDSWRSVKRYREHTFGGRPLLLLYPIDRMSEPKNWTIEKPVEEWPRLPLLYGLRHPDDLPVNVLGMGIVFPQATKSTASHFVRVRLNREIEGEVFADSDIEIFEQSEDSGT